MNKILVTGGFGFLGSHLVESLVKDQTNIVHIVDNLSTNPLPHKWLLEELGNPSNLTYSIEDVKDFCRKREGDQYDEIYHLASIVGPAGVLAHAGLIAVSMVEDTFLISQLTQAAEAKLLFVSSSEVYGGGQEGFCSESMPMIISPNVSARLEYAVGKLSVEISLQNMNKAQDLDVRIIRPFNISGPRQSGKGGFVLPRFVAQAILGKDMTVFGDGSQIRAFAHVKDIVKGMISAMAKGKRGEIYNMGNAHNRGSILALAEEVKEIVGSNSKITFVDPKQIYGPIYEDANDKYPDSRKSETELKWFPDIGRAETIRDTLGYMRGLPEDLFLQLCGFQSA